MVEVEPEADVRAPTPIGAAAAGCRLDVIDAACPLESVTEPGRDLRLLTVLPAQDD
jgi:hypothetical protein